MQTAPPIEPGPLPPRPRLRDASIVRITLKIAKWTCVVGLAVLIAWGVVVIDYVTAKPQPHVDYLALVNERALSAPESERAWPLYREALLKLTSSPELPGGEVPRPGEPGWEEVAAWLAENEQAIASLRSAAARKILGYERGAHTSPDDQPLIGKMESWHDETALVWSLYSIRLPHMTWMRLASDLLAQHARREIEFGRPNVALDDLEAMVGIAEHLMREAVFIEQLVGLATFDRALDLAGEIIPLREWSDEELRRVQSLLQNFMDGRIRISLESERMFFQDFLQHAFESGRKGEITADGVRSALQLEDGDVPRLQLMFINGPAARILVANREKQIEKYDRILAMMKVDAETPLWLRTGQAGNEISNLHMSKWSRIRYAPVVWLQASLDGAAHNATTTEMKRDAVSCAIAAKRFRLAHNRWPTTLEELVPQFLDAVPMDHFDGQPLRYLLRNDEPLLYSVGANRIDEGGLTPSSNDPESQRWRSDPSRRTDGDWILWPPAPEERVDASSAPPAPIYDLPASRTP